MPMYGRRNSADIKLLSYLKIVFDSTFSVPFRKEYAYFCYLYRNGQMSKGIKLSVCARICAFIKLLVKKRIDRINYGCVHLLYRYN